MPAKSVGLVGCGTIGSQLAMAVDVGKVPNASLASIFDINESSSQALKSRLQHSPKVCSDFASFLKSDMDIAIEAASQEAVRAYGEQILQGGNDLMVMSVGALADHTFLSQILNAAQKKECRIYIPSGAIAGLDAIRSVKHLLESVTLTTTKNPKALAGAPFFKSSKIQCESIDKKITIFEGPASEAVREFPANVNVAAVLGLAGIGAEKTRVRIVADPAATTNKHEIHATGSFGELNISVNNVPSPGNPKTSYLAILSAIECLRSICGEGMRIGS
ncbi:MAG: aspartate dehydrogenase [Nitrososphaera sp.]|nr:aspartate dehydrogenase [Nitrososphaera sp.]